MAEFKLSYTGQEIEDKLGQIAETGVTEGTYGGYVSQPSSSYYKIPNITVDSYGKITSASESLLQVANTKSAGLMSAEMYNTVSGAVSLAYSKTGTMSSSLNETCPGAFTSGQMPIMVYAYVSYVPESSTVTNVVPMDWYLIYNSNYGYYHLYLLRPANVTGDISYTVYSNYQISMTH